MAKLFGKIYSPIHHALQAVRNSSKSVLKRGGNVVGAAVGAVDNVGSSLAKHANQAVRNVTRGGRRRRNSRKTMRKHRRSGRR
jgi:hypothetical protein